MFEAESSEAKSVSGHNYNQPDNNSNRLSLKVAFQSAEDLPNPDSASRLNLTDLAITANESVDQTNLKDPIKESCPLSNDYVTLIEKAARNMYAPASLGDINQLKNKYNCQIKDTETAIDFADQALKITRDRYNDVLPPVEAVAQKERFKGEISGIGVSLKKHNQGNAANDMGPVVVEDITQGSPASKADILKGDIITHVDGINLDTLTYNQTIEKIRGQAGLPVTVTIERDGEVDSHDVTVNRGTIEIPNVKDERLDGNIGYIKLADFSQNDTVEDVKEALERQVNASSFIIDMRNNPGGQFSKGYELAALFLEKGVLLKTRERNDSDPSNPSYSDETYTLTDKGIEIENINEETKATSKSTTPRFEDIVNKPFVVLVNGSTASSAEIFTGAIKADQNEGLVLGSQTFGKGIGQTIFFNMPGGSSLKVTSFRIFTPDGKWAGDGQSTKNGITPDVVVENPPDVKLGSFEDLQLNRAKAYLKDKTGSGNNIDP